MNADAAKKVFSEFDDLASKSEDANVQFLIRAMKLHAELTNARLVSLEQALLALLKK
ncbi:hypothetical protein [Paraburkholderia phenazinium]|uniref:Uncharacterized protein n=1 Tax=Paraburkholderia phenazinium TaxID=60549 RepID=A0A1G8JRU6_9BURK|nr:hypothetical protein [Paraburkholderia phenazinium]SDI33803.1 hypothetical protein SAMN05216466_12119 [Paraburkholderia phenazinium]